MLNINANTYETLKAFGDFAIKFGSDSKAVARTGIGESGLASTTRPTRSVARQTRSF